VIPPRLSAASADRIAAAVEAADAAVDAGAPPAAAMAKAARAAALPVGHLPIAVRAFNTGRAVRQLESGDPWQKAADHPTTTVAEVTTELGTEPVEKAASDYDAPPAVSRPAPHPVPARASQWTKQAAAAALAPVPADPDPTVPRLVSLEKAARIVGDLSAVLRTVTPRAYAAIKRAAERRDPGAPEVFAYVEGADEALTHLGRKAAAADPDPTVSADHPAVVLVGALVGLRAAYRPAPEPVRPLGYVKHAADASGRWYRPRPAVPVVSLEPAPVPAAPALVVRLPEPGAKTAAGLTPTPGTDATPVGGGRTEMGKWTRSKVEDLGRATGAPFRTGFQKGFWGPVDALANNRLTAPAFALRDPGAESDDARGTVSKLRVEMDRIDQQAAVQNVMTDSRLQRSDPKTVIETYQTLADLAPNVMRNQSVAADLIHRRLQTGPLSAFDLKQLLEMEKAFVTSRRSNLTDVDDDA
jgi:hypothetical protein